MSTWKVKQTAISSWSKLESYWKITTYTHWYLWSM